MLRALGSASSDISHTRQPVRGVLASASCEISQTRQGVRFVTGIGCCVVRYHDITHETGNTICSGHWVLCLGI